MPLSPAAYVRLSAALLALGLAVLAGIVGATVWLADRNQEDFSRLVIARDIRSAATDLLAMIQASETGQRGYLLTGDRSYLAPFERSSGRIADQLDALRAAVGERSAPTVDFGALGGAIERKMSELRETIKLADAGRRADAIAVVETGRGQGVMEQIRDTLVGMIRAAEAEVDSGTIRQRESIGLLRWVTVGGALVILLVAAVGVWLLIRYTRDLGRARAAVEQLNLSLEERVRERTADLGRANEEVQRFAYIVTHDLRSPLVNIMGFTSELEASLEDVNGYLTKLPDGGDPALAEVKRVAAEDLPESIGFIRSSTLKMDGLIKAILKISRDGRRPLKPEPIDLRSMLENALGAVQHQLVENDGASVLDVHVPTIVSDRLSLEQIVGNLLDNAIKYQAADRPLRLVVKAWLATPGRIAIDVQDNGRGIAEKDYERVFELFRRAGTQTKAGEGIGLTHVRTLARNLGGDVTLKSELGVGTTFTVTIPRDLRTALRSSS